ncbi:hypothetical protein TeGR_g14877 [Tetraparma gracilis]|uniref:Secreted protein n=1 Tax=Tetraparma gracilis TaxID=2962635 RepID=A0ABQ6MEN2_9STRA|nr:hypothetical protein TeGR_g14877 [Tetraparma gracilis]
MLRLLIPLSILALGLSHPCDDLHAATCPDASGASLGGCLTSLQASSLDPYPECVAWLATHAACEAELELECEKRCEGSPCAFTEDAIPCLAFWTHPDRRANYSAPCAARLPGEKKSEEQSEERKRRNAERKRKRLEKQNAVPDEPLALPSNGEL